MTLGLMLKNHSRIGRLESITIKYFEITAEQAV